MFTIPLRTVIAVACSGVIVYAVHVDVAVAQTSNRLAEVLRPKTRAELVRGEAEQQRVWIEQAALPKNDDPKVMARIETLRLRAGALTLKLERVSGLYLTGSHGGAPKDLGIVGRLAWVAVADFAEAIGDSGEEVVCLKRAIEFADWHASSVAQMDVPDLAEEAQALDVAFRLKARLAALVGPEKAPAEVKQNGR